tara:strand:+ start:3041 stop:3202 length:162 start_codon:yes stop_codon:yes gene_type:complete
METFIKVKEFLVQEKDKIVEYQTQSWADAKLQLATNQEQITEVFNKVVAPFVN